jgi:uncharacterized protein
MGRYATHEEEIDDLFRERVLVDLYRVVTQSMQISRPSYSLKEVENFYDQGREAEVKQAGDSVLRFEKWRESGEADLLQAIEDYNREDCDSTLRLRDWLLAQREACEAEFDVQIPWRARGMPTEPDEEKSAALAETLALQETLLKGVPEDPLERSSEQGATWLLAQLLDYHRRAAKPAYWEYFDRLERPTQSCSSPTERRSQGSWQSATQSRCRLQRARVCSASTFRPRSTRSASAASPTPTAAASTPRPASPTRSRNRSRSPRSTTRREP